MIEALIKQAIRHRWLVLSAALLTAGFGLYAFRHLPIDAYPDIAAQRVSVVSIYSGRAPEEVERQVTIPLEIALRNVPRVESVRSESTFGLSCVDLVFKDGTETYWARQRVQEKLAGVELPEGVRPELGPIVSSCGEIFRYQLVSDGTTDVMELRTLHEWVVIPRLLRVKGVGDVSNFGGLAKQFAITYHPAALERYGLTLTDLVEATKTNNASAGGSMLPRGSMSLVIRSAGSLENIRQIENTFVKSIGGTPVYLKDVATVGVDAATPSSIYSKDRTDAAVEGIVLMRRGENPSRVLVDVKAAVRELNESALPRGVQIVPFYDRQYLVDSTLHTVAHSVTLGITLVVLVLLLFLGRPAMALLVSLTIPFALLFALGLMYLTNIPIGLLSIGAIDFGIIVDGAVIMAENIARRLGEIRCHNAREVLPAERCAVCPRREFPESRCRDVRMTLAVIRDAALDMQRPVLVSVLLIMVAFLPLLSLTSIEGLLFRPMALTILYALLGALLFSLLLVPVLALVFFRHGYPEWENPLLRWFTPVYIGSVNALLKARWLVAVVSVGCLALVFVRLVPRLGVEFLPYLDEGPVWVKANFPAGTSLRQTAAFGKRLREIALELADVRFASMQVGRTEAWTEPFPPSRIELMIGLKPQREWTQFKNKADLVGALGQRVREEFPTTRFSFTQPIIDMVLQDANGTSADLGIEITGPDSEVLQDLGRRAVSLLRGMHGAQDANIEQHGPQAQLQIVPDRRLCARYNVKIDDVTNLINTALGGEPVGTLYEGDRRFDIVVKLDRAVVTSPQAIGRIHVHTAEGLPVPLSQVASIEVADGQTTITRTASQRRITARCDIVGRDQGGFVKEAQERFGQEISLPPGYRVQWLGMFENLDRAYNHFMRLIPTTIAIIFLMLVVSFGSLRAAFILLLPIPFAFVSGALALYLRHMNLNVSTGVGFATLFGIAIMDGVLMFKGITKYRLQGASVDEAIIRGRIDRLRPILMTSLVAVLGLLPASLATTLGSDVQRPLATVIIWGLTGSTLFTLFVTPVFYRIFVPPLRAESADDIDLEVSPPLRELVPAEA